MKLPPLRRVVTVGAGSSHLECGHIVSTTPRMWAAARKAIPTIVRARCKLCLPLAERLEYIEAKRKAK